MHLRYPLQEPHFPEDSIPRVLHTFKNIISSFGQLTGLVPMDTWLAIQSTAPLGLTNLRYLGL